MARLEELSLDLFACVTLHRVAVEAISDLAPLVVGRRVALMLTEPPGTTGNHAAIVLALTNRLDDVLAYAPPGSTVEVAAPATIRVLDHGPGVPEAGRSAIFERFHRGQGAHPGGSGLGLAIVAEIAAARSGPRRARAAAAAAFVPQLGAGG